MNILYLMTARGGSKRVPDKNLREIAGLSLIGFKAIGARRSKYCTRLIISTDNSDIQAEARKYGVEVLFTRPTELATDTAYSVDVVMHAMKWIEDNTSERYDAVMLLEPSTPLTRPMDYDSAVQIMAERDANIVVGVCKAREPSTFMGPLDQDGRITEIIDRINRASAISERDVAPEYALNGAFYLFKWDFFKKHKVIYKDRDNSYGYPMEPHYSIEIDEMIDLQWVEFLVEKGYVDMSYWRWE